jgi:hypothetical protein
VIFNDDLLISTVTAENFTVFGNKTGVHASSPSYNSGSRSVTFNQAGMFSTSETVTCTVETGVQDKAGNPMAYAFTLNFTTTSEVPPSTTVTFKVYLQGYYQVGSDTQLPATLEVELRSGGSAGTAKTIIATQEVSLDQTGTGTAEINAPFGDYYFVVKHKLPGLAAGSNHLSVITNSTKSFGAGPLTLNLTDGTDLAYTPSGSPTAEWTETNGKFSLRGGNANGDLNIRIVDFGIWLAANGKDLGQSGFDPQADFDNDGRIRITDFGIWLSNNGKDSYVPTVP